MERATSDTLIQARRSNFVSSQSNLDSPNAELASKLLRWESHGYRRMSWKLRQQTTIGEILRDHRFVGVSVSDIRNLRQ